MRFPCFPCFTFTPPGLSTPCRVCLGDTGLTGLRGDEGLAPQRKPLDALKTTFSWWMHAVWPPSLDVGFFLREKIWWEKRAMCAKESRNIDTTKKRTQTSTNRCDHWTTRKIALKIIWRDLHYEALCDIYIYILRSQIQSTITNLQWPMKPKTSTPCPHLHAYVTLRFMLLRIRGSGKNQHGLKHRDSMKQKIKNGVFGNFSTVDFHELPFCLHELPWSSRVFLPQDL